MQIWWSSLLGQELGEMSQMVILCNIYLKGRDHLMKMSLVESSSIKTPIDENRCKIVGKLIHT